MKPILVVSILVIFASIVFLNLYFRIKVLKYYRKLRDSNVEFEPTHLLNRARLQAEVLPHYPEHSADILAFSNHIRFFISLRLCAYCAYYLICSRLYVYQIIYIIYKHISVTFVNCFSSTNHIFINMKKNLLFGLSFALSLVPFFAQAQLLPNLDFDQWTRAASNKYDEPSGGVWATPNPTLDVAIGNNPAPVTKVTAAADVQHGTAAAKLTTVTLFGLKATGSIFTGKFVFNLANPTQSAKLGVPFTARPAIFRGWFKATQVNGDSDE